VTFFKRNDAMLEIVPVGVNIFPDSGITSNLADKAKKLGIPVLDHRRVARERCLLLFSWVRLRTPMVAEKFRYAL